MSDPLNKLNKCLLLGTSSFVLVVFVSVIFMRCTSKDTNSILSENTVDPSIVSDQDSSNVKRESASFSEGPELKKNGSPTKISAVSMLDNYEVKSVKAVVKGTSSVHDWESNITKLSCNPGSGSGKNRELVVKIPVKGIKGKEGKKMDEKTYEAFKADQFPYITYSFDDIQVAIDNNKNVNLTTDGNLTMAGVTKPVSMQGAGRVLENGDYQIKVSRKIKMTDFKIDPPTMVLGTIKVGDEISVDFDIFLSKIK